MSRPGPQTFTSRALTWIRCKLGKQYLWRKVTQCNLHHPGNQTQNLPLSVLRIFDIFFFAIFYVFCCSFLCRLIPSAFHFLLSSSIFVPPPIFHLHSIFGLCSVFNLRSLYNQRSVFDLHSTFHLLGSIFNLRSVFDLRSTFDCGSASDLGFIFDFCSV